MPFRRLFPLSLSLCLILGYATASLGHESESESAGYAANFDDCGVLRTSGNCLLFQPDNRQGLYKLENTGNFTNGQRVHVSGYHDPYYFCPCGARCIRSNTISLGCSNTCTGIPLDASNDGRKNIGDVTFLLTHIFVQPQPIPCLEQADCNGNGRVDIGDISCMLGLIW